jgi:ElaB/YqjD/DUF883 family membrane-anchored ribosome-binding protein
MPDYSELKQSVIAACENLISARLESYEQEAESLKESAQGESKSSAGDKHETSREHIQRERELIAQRIHEAKSQLSELQKAAQPKSLKHIDQGSLVFSEMGYFFIGVALGFVNVGDIKVACVSIASPIGIAMRGKNPGETFQINGKTVEIHASN